MAKARSTYFTYATPHGPLTLRATERGLVQVVFGQEQLEGAPAASAITNAAATQLQEYLAGKRTRFDVPLDPQGSAFQQAVWTELCAIPYGQTRTAADIANQLGKPGAHRAVGTAIRQNKLAPFVPSHRVPAPNATGKQANLFRALQALEAKTQQANGNI